MPSNLETHLHEKQAEADLFSYVVDLGPELKCLLKVKEDLV